MAFPGRPSVTRRQKEIERQQRQKAKAAQRVERRKERKDAPREGGEDPDIAGIVPGPQPGPEED